MRVIVSAAIMAASLLGTGTAWSACPPGKPAAGQSRNCLDLDLVPQISQQIGASERIATRPKTTASADEWRPAYTGPTLGVSKTVGQAPMVGYRWAID